LLRLLAVLTHCLRRRAESPIEFEMELLGSARLLSSNVFDECETLMPKITIVMAALLIVLGVGAFYVSSSRTALLPAAFGAALLACGALALAFDGARKHLMHVAAVVALLGALAPAAALAIRAAQMSALALSVNLGMLALCVVLLAMQIRAFKRARAAA
jgi:uncharacterized membrane protein HdeD (DUF308 family)